VVMGLKCIVVKFFDVQGSVTECTDFVGYVYIVMC